MVYKIYVPLVIVCCIFANVPLEAKNIAREGKATASSRLNDYYSAEKAVDGKLDYPESAWVSAVTNEPHWLSITWDKPKKVSAIRIHFLGNYKKYPWGFSPCAFEIQALEVKGDEKYSTDTEWVTFKKVKDNRLSPYVLEGLGLSTRGIRINILCATYASSLGSQYEDHHVGRIREIEIQDTQGGFDECYTKQDRRLNIVRAKRSEYFKVKNPLFAQLLGNEPVFNVANGIPYWADSTDYRDRNRILAKKFAFRYVWEEEWKEAKELSLIPIGRPSSTSIKNKVPTFAGILYPGDTYGAPAVFGTAPWVMDPKWREEFVRRSVGYAKKYKGKTDQLWGLMVGDEFWEAFCIKEVPKDKWYDFVEQADKEIKEKYGSGKYGIPDSRQDDNPFKRIAFRRWASDKLVELMKRTYREIKKENPEMVFLGPDFAGAVPAADIEEMSKYCDAIPYQSWNISAPLTNQLSIGCDTKCIADLAECPVLCNVQNTISRGEVPSIEDIRERYSQVFRNSGDGIVLLATEWYDRQMPHPRYNDPHKWMALKEVAQQVMQLRKPKLPEVDCAILYSSDTLLTFGWPQMTDNNHKELYSAYTTLGPIIGSWFNFVSDRQIDRGTRDLNKYKALYIPMAEYERACVLEKVSEYVEDGGTVICTDPKAFSWDITGEPLTDKWEKLTGLQIAKERKGTKSARVVSDELGSDLQGMKFDFPSAGFVAKLTGKNANPLVIFDDGSIAVSMNKVGKGKIIQFATNVWVVSPELDSPYNKFFRHVQEYVGAKTNRDIWRFKLPSFKNVDIKDKEKYLCLTNNNVVFDATNAVSKHNLTTNGTYKYDHFPTGIVDVEVEDGKEISFNEGHLTNRPEACNAERFESLHTVDVKKWIVSWKDYAPVSITFDLKKNYYLDTVKIFYSGILPGVKIESSADGQNWQEIGASNGLTGVDDCIDITVPLSGSGRYVKINLAERTTYAEMQLSEVEIWGSATKKKQQQEFAVGIRKEIVTSNSEYARNSCSDLLVLDDGNWLFAWTRYGKGRKGDNSKADIMVMRSQDEGETWDEPQILVRNKAGNVMLPSLLILDDKILLTYVSYGTGEFERKARIFYQFIDMELKPATLPVALTPREHHSGTGCAALRRLSNGRIILPFYWSAGAAWAEDEHYKASVVYSDDGGKSWEKSAIDVDAPNRGADEPTVEELSDGRLLMLIRTQTGRLYQSISEDYASTWSQGVPSLIVSTESMPQLKRIPNTNKLLLAWNDNYHKGFPHCGIRSPLSLAVSEDEGQSWRKISPLEQDLYHMAFEPTIAFTSNLAIFTYNWSYGSYIKGDLSLVMQTRELNELLNEGF